MESNNDKKYNTVCGGIQPPKLKPPKAGENASKNKNTKKKKKTKSNKLAEYYDMNQIDWFPIDPYED